MRFVALIIFAIFGSGIIRPVQADPPRHVVLFMIDGLHWQAPSKVDMPVLKSLISEGTYIEKSCMILPHHPTIGDYSEHNSCSFPNPMLHAGTMFLKPDNRYIQEVFPAEKKTAFVVNATAYRSVARGFTTTVMDAGLADREVLEHAKAVFELTDPVFMRIHLQTPGAMGTEVALFSGDKPYARDIFGEGSPYVKAVEEADRLLGQFVVFLKEKERWEETVLIVTSDHGQSDIGWHPLFDEDSWFTPLVFAGADIARGRRLTCFEHTDLAPTIAWLLSTEAPASGGGAGKAVEAVRDGAVRDGAAKDGVAKGTGQHPGPILKLNRQIREYNMLKSRLMLQAENDRHLSNVLAALENENLTPEPFYHQDRVMEWHRAGTRIHLIRANEKILEDMRRALKDSNTKNSRK